MAYNSGSTPKSAILASTYMNRLNAMFGFQTVSNKANAGQSAIEKRYGIKFVRVDLSNPAYRIKNAAIGSVFESTKLSTNLEKYFDAYLNDNTISYSDIQDRQGRLNELSFMYYNDPYIQAVCKLAADEATQINAQNRLISVESPNLAFTQRCYELFSIWGLTPQRIHGVCFDLQLYGESFWAHKLSVKTGISKIIPISVNEIMERLEFNPEKMAKYIAEKEGYLTANKNRSSKLEALMNMLKTQEAFDMAENCADMFDSKLFGYELQDGQVLPPWCISHFRFDADHSEFAPYGRPPLLGALAPFKSLISTMNLQGLARAMSFPVTLYKVHISEGMSPGRAFELVEEVKEEYDNIGVSVSSAGNEFYTPNTKIWIPDGLLDIEIKESKVDIGSIEDLELYNKRMAIAAGVPRGYVDPTEEAYGQSRVALVEQFAPFAHHISQIQSTFLQGLGELIRLHFAITGEFDYNTPFILNMRFPGVEMSSEQRQARTESMELAKAVADLLKTALGLSDEDILPQDVMEDILAKYSFLDPTDINRWLNRTAFLNASKLAAGGDDEEGGGDEGGGGLDLDDMSADLDLGGDMGGEEPAAEEPAADLGEVAAESMNYKDLQKHYTLYQERQKYLKKKNALREQALRERYNNVQQSLYFKFLEQQNFNEWVDSDSKYKKYLVPKISENSLYYESIKVWDHELIAGEYAKLEETAKLDLKNGVAPETPKSKKASTPKIMTASNEEISKAIEDNNLGDETSLGSGGHGLRI